MLLAEASHLRNHLQLVAAFFEWVPGTGLVANVILRTFCIVLASTFAMRARVVCGAVACASCKLQFRVFEDFGASGCWWGFVAAAVVAFAEI